MATMPYLNGPAGQTVKANSVYYDAISLQPGKTVQDVTLPNVSSLHVFTLAIG